MRKVLLRFYANKNLGDDLMIEQLLNNLPQFEFYALSRNKEALGVFLEYPNFKILSRPIWALFRQHFDAYVLVGGSVLNYDHISGLYEQIKEILLCSLQRLHRTKTIVLGANMSNIPGSMFALLSRSILRLRIRLLDLITVRDSFTAEQLHEFAADKLTYSPDIVFGIPMPRKEDKNRDGQILGISVYAGGRSPGSQCFCDQLVYIIDRYLEREDRSAVLFAFHANEDVPAMRRVLGRIKKSEQVNMIVYDGNRQAFLEQISRCDRFIAIRFHAIVLCFKLGIPFVPIIYSNKSKNLLDDMGYRDMRLNTDALDHNTANLIVDIIENLTPQDTIANVRTIEGLEADAKTHYRKLEELLQV